MEERIDLSELGFEITIPAPGKGGTAYDDFCCSHDDNDVNDDDTSKAVGGREEEEGNHDDAASLKLPTNQSIAHLVKDNPSLGKLLYDVDVARVLDMSDLGLEDPAGEDPSPALLGYEDGSFRGHQLPSRAQLGYDDASLQAGLSRGKPIRNLRSSIRRSQNSAMSGLRSSCSSSGMTSHSSYWKEEEEWESLRHKQHDHHHQEQLTHRHHSMRALSTLSQRSSPLVAVERPVKRLSISNTPTGRRSSLRHQRRFSLEDQPRPLRRQSYCEGLVRAANSHDYLFRSLQDLGATDFVDTRRIRRMPSRVSLEYDDDGSSNSSRLPRRVSLQFSVASGGGYSSAASSQTYGPKRNSRTPRRVSLEFHQSCTCVDENTEGVALQVIERRGSLDYSVRTSCLPRRSSGSPLAPSPLRSSRRASLGAVYLGHSATNQRSGFLRPSSSSSLKYHNQNHHHQHTHGDEYAPQDRYECPEESGMDSSNRTSTSRRSFARIPRKQIGSNPSDGRQRGVATTLELIAVESRRHPDAKVGRSA